MIYNRRTQLISVSEALQRLLSSFHPLQSEMVSLADAAGRVLYEGIRSDLDLPLFTNSSMDGFAIRSQDVHKASKDNPVQLSIVEDIPAGKTPTIGLGKNQASRIMTGAPLPEGADAVIPVENTDQFDPKTQTSSGKTGEVWIYQSAKPGNFVRHRGEDVHEGDLILEANAPLKPQELGILAMLGKAEVSVYRRPKIAIVSTGDELVPLGKTLKSGQIHDSNAYTLFALIKRDYADAQYLGIVPDNEESVTEILKSAVDIKADLILSSAGVSVGVFDYVRKVVQREGELDFWRVNMRPGKPIAFGNFHGVRFIGLPGNPVSAFVGYEVFVRPAILKLSGIPRVPRHKLKARLVEEIESDGRESYLRGIVTFENNEWSARLTGHQGSGNMLSLVHANALLVIPSGVKSLAAGMEVDTWLLE